MSSFSTHTPSPFFCYVTVVWITSNIRPLYIDFIRGVCVLELSTLFTINRNLSRVPSLNVILWVIRQSWSIFNFGLFIGCYVFVYLRLWSDSYLICCTDFLYLISCIYIGIPILSFCITTCFFSISYYMYYTIVNILHTVSFITILVYIIVVFCIYPYYLWF